MVVVPQQPQDPVTRAIPVGVVVRPSRSPSTGSSKASGATPTASSVILSTSSGRDQQPQQPQQPVFAVPSRRAAMVPMVEWRNTFNVRPVLVSALRNRQGHRRPERGAETRGTHGAARSLDLLRIALQSAINKDIKQVLNKYRERFFKPAMENIRANVGARPARPARGCGEESLEEHVRLVLQRALEEAKTIFSRSSGSCGASRSRQSRNVLSLATSPTSATAPLSAPIPIAVPVVKFQNGVLSKSPPPATLQQMFKKRKEMDAEAEARRKRARLSSMSPSPGPPSGTSASAGSLVAAVPGAAVSPPQQATVHINYHSPKWDPARINPDTLFVVGARANKVLGYETSRGRLYSKHQDLFKYASDQEDKEWLARNQLIQPTGGKAFLCVLQDIHELAVSSEYKNNPNVNLLELKGFRAPDFLLKKIRAYMRNLRTEPLDDLSGLLEMDLLQEDGVANMDDSSLMELALEYGVTLLSEDRSPPSAPAAPAVAPATPTTTASSEAVRAMLPSLDVLTATTPAPERTKGEGEGEGLMMMETLALEELEMYIKSHSVDVEGVGVGDSLGDPAVGEANMDAEMEADGTLDASLDASLEANLDANLDLNLDVNLDVSGAEHNQLELAWDLIGELSPSASPSAHQADAFPPETDAEKATREHVTAIAAVESETLPAARTSSASSTPNSVSAPSSTASTSSTTSTTSTASTVRPETPLAMSHATLTALLSGSTLEGLERLEIPDGLL